MRGRRTGSKEDPSSECAEAGAQDVMQTEAFGDVGSLLRRPLLAGLKTGRTQSDVGGTANVEPGCSPGLWRGHSAPCVGVPNFDDQKHLDNNQDGHSILFKAMLAIVIYFGFGMLGFYFLGNYIFGPKTQSFIDALYFSVVTLTTVGYGDIVPGTTVGKLFTCAFILVGFSLVSALINGAAHYLVGRQEQIIVHAMKRNERPIFEEPEDDHAKAATWKALLSGIVLLALIFFGIGCLILIEGMTFVEALYCVCVTVTTVGYGDTHFRRQSGRLIAAIWILTSTVSLAQFLLSVAEMRVANRQQKLAHWVLHRRTTRPDLEAADLDGDGFVSAPEFVIFKLKELGKICETDLVGILKEFQALDYDRSGAISTGDLSLAQGSCT